MAEIIEQLDTLWQKHLRPALQGIAPRLESVWLVLRDRLRTWAQEPLPPASTTTAPEQAQAHRISPVPQAHAEETVAQLQQRLQEGDDVFTSVELLCIVDDAQTLQGVVCLGALLGAAPSAQMKDLLVRDIGAVTPTDPPERVAELALKHRISAVPVVDEHGRLLGAVPAQVVFKTLREEYLRDMDRLVGIRHHTEQALSAIEGDPLSRMWDRLPWLLVGTLGCVLATSLMASFENTLKADLAAAFFIPGIVYLADAIGTQSEAIAVRGLSLTGTPIPQLLKGELKTGFFLGLALALVVFPLIWLTFTAKLAFAVSLALICASSVATSIGLLLPSILSRLGRDPAYGSGPVATIVQDVLSLLIYLSVVSWLLW